MNKKILIVGIIFCSIVLAVLVVSFILEASNDCNLPSALIDGKNSQQIIQELNSQGIYLDMENLTIYDYLESSRIGAFVKYNCN